MDEITVSGAPEISRCAFTTTATTGDGPMKVGDIISIPVAGCDYGYGQAAQTLKRSAFDRLRDAINAFWEAWND